MGAVHELAGRIGDVLAKRNYVAFAYLFGSQVRGKPMVKGDVDAAIYTNRGIS